MNRREFLRVAGMTATGMPFWAGLLPETLWGKIPSGIKITTLKTFVVHLGSVNWVFVKIYTNEGLVGLGEGSVTSKEATIAAAIHEHERMIVGKDPTQIEMLWQSMYRWPRWRGGPVLNSAISAVEIALWDILGKLLDAPIYRLLGGAARERIRLYVHGGGTTPETAAEAIGKAKERGYNALKTGPLVAEGETIQRPWDLKRAVAVIEAMRRAAGDRFDIMIDAHGLLNPVMAMEYANAVAPYRPMFLEEPIQPEDLDMMQWLGQHTNVPLATGERLFTKFGFKDLISRHLVSYVQPDVVHAGGISECKKIAAMAEANFIDVALHNPQSLVSTLASLHIDASTPNCVIQETTGERPEWVLDLFNGVDVSIKNGYAELPEKPGLGCELNERVAAAHPYQPVNRPAMKFEDGSVMDH
jgi:galactonate dehydratase